MLLLLSRITTQCLPLKRYSAAARQSADRPARAYMQIIQVIAILTEFHLTSNITVAFSHASSAHIMALAMSFNRNLSSSFLHPSYIHAFHTASTFSTQGLDLPVCVFALSLLACRCSDDCVPGLVLRRPISRPAVQVPLFNHPQASPSFTTS